LVHFAWASAHTAEWDAAAAAAQEAAGLGRDTSQPQYGLTAELVFAWIEGMRGPSAPVEAILAEPERELHAMKGGPLLATAHLARGAAALGEGRHQDAFEHLWPVFDETDGVFHRFMRWSAVLDLAEAAWGCSRVKDVHAVVAELDGIATRGEAPILRAGLLCAKPLLESDEDAGDLFTKALAANLDALPFHRARTLFSYGRWLRRKRRSADSRSPLRESIRVFDALGARSWADRARLELRATGETIGPRTALARDQLTAQELQIAQLAARGLSNRAIGERLSLSPRTIGGHLYRIFPKVGISGRAQLRDVLEPVDSRES
jgi:DNA-binding CsgD family transcriptional regulator